jgi:chitodextrinase
MPTPNVPHRPMHSKSSRRRRRSILVAVTTLVVGVVTCAAGAAHVRDNSPPTMPKRLALAKATSTSVTLSWTRPKDNFGVGGYMVYLAGRATMRTTATTYTIGSLACSTTYRVGVAAYDAAGNQSRTAWISVSTAACAPAPPPPSPPPSDIQPPSAPSNMRVTSSTTTSIGLAWTASTDNVGVAGYDIYLADVMVWMTTGTTFTHLGLSCGRAYVVALEAYDAAGNRSSRASITASTAPCPSPVGCAAGQYQASYFNNLNLAAPEALARCENAPLNQHWGAGSPAGVNADNVSARYTGSFGFQTGAYTFSYQHDDGIRVFVDGALVVDKWGNVPSCPCPNTGTFSRAMTAGSHAIKVEFQELYGAADIALSWAPSSSSPPPPPPPPPAGVTYITPQEGKTVSEITPVRVRVPTGTEWIGVYACGGASVGEDLVPDAPNEFSVDWNTRMAACANGDRGLDAWAFKNNGDKLGNKFITVNVQNAPQPPPAPPPPPPPPSGEPAPIAGQGYTRVFADEFDVLNRGVWCSHQWWEPEPPLNVQYANQGILHVVTRRVNGYPNTTITSEPCGQANPKSFKQGYFEARMKWTAGNGSSPAFWLFSTRHATNPAWPNVNPFCAQNALPVAECYSGELDVFEGQGNQPGTFIGTIHRNSCGCYGVQNQLRQGVPTQNIGVNMTTGFHTYSMEWTSTTIRWYLDDVLLGSVQPFDSSNQPMHLLFYQWPQSWTRDTDATSPDELHTEVDWVRVWQK